MLVSRYFVEFVFFSFLGWIWESIYCSVKERKWADRGFLFGPICPIYGTCVVVVSSIFSTCDLFSDPGFPVWGIFIVCYIGSAVAEYATSWVLEKRFHARWWDYSSVPLNIQGRICVPASIGFGLAGVAIVKYLIPAMDGMLDTVNPLVYEILTLLFAGLLGADIALTEASLSTLLTEVENMHKEFNERAQKNFEKITSAPKLIEQRFVSGYAQRLSLNQKRVLLGIQKFMPGTGNTYQDSFIHITEALRENVHDLRKRRSRGKENEIQ